MVMLMSLEEREKMEKTEDKPVVEVNFNNYLQEVVHLVGAIYTSPLYESTPEEMSSLRSGLISQVVERQSVTLANKVDTRYAPMEAALKASKLKVTFLELEVERYKQQAKQQSQFVDQEGGLSSPLSTLAAGLLNRKDIDESRKPLGSRKKSSSAFVKPRMRKVARFIPDDTEYMNFSIYSTDIVERVFYYLPKSNQKIVETSMVDELANEMLRDKRLVSGDSVQLSDVIKDAEKEIKAKIKQIKKSVKAEIKELIKLGKVDKKSVEPLATIDNKILCDQYGDMIAGSSLSREDLTGDLGFTDPVKVTSDMSDFCRQIAAGGKKVAKKKAKKKTTKKAIKKKTSKKTAKGKK